MKVTALQVTAISAFLPSIAYAGQDSSSIQTCCRELRAAGLHNVYLPSNPKYDKAVGSYWSLTSQLKPYCFVQPENAQEVALAVETLVNKTFCNFAVRSGGHSSVTGFGNIEDGVTIDLARLNSTTYDAESCIASLRPGSRWLGAYETLDKIGVGVPGARLGLVGVGGSTLGGGLSYWLHEKGMVCDSVVRYQVVLANGDIIEASADQHQDLFKALKGGGGAFGIVTRFDMAAFNANPLWGGVFEYPESSTDGLVPALKHWTDNADKYPPGTAWTFWTYQSLLKKTSVFVGLVDTTGKADDPAFDEFRSVPGKVSGELTTTNMSTLALGSRPDGYRDIWFSLTFKNEERILRKSLELHDKFVEEMKAEFPNADYQTQCMLQPFPAIVAKAGEERGGNILGIEGQKDNGMILLGTIAVRGVAQEKFARGKILAWKDAMEKYTKKVNGHIDYIYMNYADGSQNPLLSYGKENVETMREVLSKYDPNGVFRKRVPGGFDLTE